MKELFSFLKKVFAVILVLVMAICSGQMYAYASENANQSIIYFEDYCENPLYHSNTASSESNVQGIGGSYVTEVKYTNSADQRAEKAAAVKIRDYMIARKGTFTINIQSKRTDYAALVTEIFKLAISKELADSPTAGDYLAWQYGGYSYGGSATVDANGVYDYSFNFNVSYYTTAAQEQKVTKTVETALDAMKLENLSTYAKIKSIYDYVCKVCSYDHSTSKDYTKFTAYGAAINKKAVCQGYSVLLYRMLEEAGIDNKIITSTDHSWNIVQIDNKYYNLDATWDDNYYDQGYNYMYFLKCAAHFDNHNREPEYKTKAFNEKYAMTEQCLNPSGAGKSRTIASPCSSVASNSSPAAPKVTVAKAKTPTLTVIANGFKVKWTKMSGVNGYQIQYAAKSNFSGATTVKITSASTVSKTITGRGYGKKYYVRIRAYKNTGNSVVYGAWSAAKNATTPAKPKTVKLSSVKAAARAFTVKWSKVSGVSGYQIQYATNGSFKKATTVTASSAATSKKITKQAAKKKYYVRVRAYKKVNGTYVYGGWSSVKSVVTKK